MSDRRRSSARGHHGYSTGGDPYYDPNYAGNLPPPEEDPSTPRYAVYENHDAQHQQYGNSYDPPGYTTRQGRSIAPQTATRGLNEYGGSYNDMSYPPQFSQQHYGVPGSNPDPYSPSRHPMASGQGMIGYDQPAIPETGFMEPGHRYTSQTGRSGYPREHRSSGTRHDMAGFEQPLLRENPDPVELDTRRTVERHHHRNPIEQEVDDLEETFRSTRLTPGDSPYDQSTRHRSNTGASSYDQNTQRRTNTETPLPLTRISTSNTNSKLDSRYKVQRPGFFKLGRVFSLLWHEAPGSTRTNQSYISEAIFEVRYGEEVYSGIRRMVVIKELAQCSCAVYTYGNRGVGKNTADASKHTIIYMEGNRPVQGTQEPPLTKEPLEVRPISPDQKLNHMSRLNFGKLYTVEHNVKVREVGKITERSLAKFVDYARAEFAI
ncbi:hypothetical protein FE257_009427 [Aspergillus nanangensis]|uniref:DUF6590 domain-containing protein n=1 Tax=Aspergillus nanangensis TaxID=2582783 RepID=A0AAD4GSS8_ASPNN|nr:hypothetical protein FE257_009427 [Aspergillus nanangensis]